jgi:uncharacterized repeat protein (TIGR01451 family)
MVGSWKHRCWWSMAVLVCALACAGCRNFLPRIDPTGNRIFIPPPPTRNEPDRLTHRYDSGVVVTPAKVIAPVGSEVVMLATVCSLEGKPRPSQRVEWMLDPGGAGQFIAVGDRGPAEVLHLAANRPHKVDNTFAIGQTLYHPVTLNRGTPAPSDDIVVGRGQAWLTLSSPVEGVSHVTAYAPEVYGWDSRKQTASVHWIDATWAFPPPSTNPSGSRHTFTTTVSRHTNATPIMGWRVRYEIAGGPPAGFAPDGAQMVEVTTNSIGQGIVEMFQKQPLPGANQINVQIIRPAEIEGASGERLIIASGITYKTWTSPQVSLRKSGPAHGSVGGTLTYRIEVRNTAELTVKEVAVTEQLTPGLSFLGSTPPATPAAGKLVWRLGDLRGGEARTIELNLRADRAGALNNCAVLTTAEGLTAQDCVTTTIVVPAIDVTINGPSQAAVGQTITFEATISNRGDSPLTGLVLVNRFDAGLKHPTLALPGNSVEQSLADIPPGQSQRFNITLQAVQPGPSCTSVEVHGDLGVQQSSRACVNVTGPTGPVVPPVGGPGNPATSGATGTPAPTPGGPAAPAAVPGGKPVLTVKKTGPAQQTVGQTVIFNIEVTNSGNAPATNVKIVDNYDQSLNATRATAGSARVGADIVWNIPTLLPNAKQPFQVECQCLTAQQQACNRVTVTSGEGLRSDDTACLQITPAAAGLGVAMTSLRNPAIVGSDITYQITVTNKGTASDRNLSVVFTAPPETTPLPDPNGALQNPALMTAKGQSIQFDPVREIRAGETLQFKVVVRANRIGSVRPRVDVTSTGSPQPVAAEVKQDIIGQ